MLLRSFALKASLCGGLRRDEGIAPYAPPVGFSLHQRGAENAEPGPFVFRSDNWTLPDPE